MQAVEFYQEHLDRVSRSFAFCIPKLDSPFREWTALSYLVFRLLDTVEDSPWPTASQRAAAYSAFEEFLECPPAPKDVSQWRKPFSSAIPEGERRLLEDAGLILADLHALPADVQAALRSTVNRMSVGMRYYSERADSSSLRLSDIVDVNRYCYFVAGVVGDLLTQLYAIHRKDFHPPPYFRKDAFHFGLFLQKINLLKDQRRDESEGRFLVPDREELSASLRENAIHSVDYITSLPREEKGYRTFCCWSLFLGAASLPWIFDSFEKKTEQKIPREVTQELLSVVEGICQDNEALTQQLNEFLSYLPCEKTSPLKAKGEGAWFLEICGDSLNRDALVELGVLGA